MIAFQISDIDVKTAIQKGFDVDISDDKAEACLSLLDQQLVSDQAAFDGDMDEATERARINIIFQITRDPKKFSAIFA